MSMTYYAVTDDPNELAHFGIKGMKWGVRHDKPRHSGSRKPRSAAYKKAQNKLGRMMKSGIKKAEAHWNTYNSPAAKEARFMKKAMQQARNGTLKYGKLTDSQVRQVTDRLALERNARVLGGTENPKYIKRLASSVGEGIIRGTGAYVEERLRGRGRSTANIKGQKRMAKYEARNSTLRRAAKKEAKEEFYREQAKEGNLNSKAATLAKLGFLAVADPKNQAYKDERTRLKYSLTQKGQAKLMAAKRAEDKENERAKRQQEARDKAYYQNLGKLESQRDYKNLSISNIEEPKAIVRRTSKKSSSNDKPKVIRRELLRYNSSRGRL